MKKVLLIFLICIFAPKGYGQDRIMVSDNAQFNAVVNCFSGYKTSPTGYFLSAQIEKANKSNGVFRNLIRLWYGENNDEYINLLYDIYPTEELARLGLKNEYGDKEQRLIVDWNSVFGTSVLIDLKGTSFREISNRAKRLTQINRTYDYSKEKFDNRDTVVFDISFEGINLTESFKLEGVDIETQLNASYYSREKHIIDIQGSNNKAWAEIAKAPKRKGQALHFIAVSANDRDIAGEKIRVTGSVSGLKATAIINSVDIYLPRSMKALTKHSGAITWLTVQEYWCAVAGPPLEGEPQFRMTLGMLKKSGKGEGLYFDLKAQDLISELQNDGSLQESYTTLYELDDRESRILKIPFGEWFNLRTEIIAGDKKSGHFRLIVTNKRGKETVVFDKICQTFATGYLTEGTKKPLYKSESPLKLYTSANTLKTMKGKPLEIFFDNWSYKALCIKDE